MTYFADCTPIFADTYLCDILDKGGDVVLTLTTEVIDNSVAVYFGGEIARERVASFTDRKTVFDSLERLVLSLVLPADLRDFALAQLTFARTDMRRPAFGGTIEDIIGAPDAVTARM